MGSDIVLHTVNGCTQAAVTNATNIGLAEKSRLMRRYVPKVRNRRSGGLKLLTVIESRGSLAMPTPSSLISPTGYCGSIAALQYYLGAHAGFAAIRASTVQSESLTSEFQRRRASLFRLIEEAGIAWGSRATLDVAHYSPSPLSPQKDSHQLVWDQGNREHRWFPFTGTADSHMGSIISYDRMPLRELKPEYWDWSQLAAWL